MICQWGKLKFAQIIGGVNQTFYKIIGGKLKISQIIGGEILHKGLKENNFSFTRTKIKTKNSRVENLYYKGKTLLTLRNIHHQCSRFCFNDFETQNHLLFFLPNCEKYLEFYL